jgi:hypothetical protein
VQPYSQLSIEGHRERAVATGGNDELKVFPARFVPLGVLGPSARIEAKLMGHEVWQTRVWAFPRPQNLPRKAKVAELDGEPQTVCITAPLLDEGQIRRGEGIAADEFVPHLQEGQQERPVGGRSDSRVGAWECLFWGNGLEDRPG